MTKTRRKIKAKPKPKKPSIEEVVRFEISANLSGFLTVANSISIKLSASSQNIDRLSASVEHLGERIESLEEEIGPVRGMERRLLYEIEKDKVLEASIKDMERYKIVLEAYREETKERLAKFEEWLNALTKLSPQFQAAEPPPVNGTGGWKRFFS